MQDKAMFEIDADDSAEPGAAVEVQYSEDFAGDAESLPPVPEIKAGAGLREATTAKGTYEKTLLRIGSWPEKTALFACLATKSKDLIAQVSATLGKEKKVGDWHKI